jgi:hypothetical protein
LFLARLKGYFGSHGSRVKSGASAYFKYLARKPGDFDNGQDSTGGHFLRVRRFFCRIRLGIGVALRSGLCGGASM